MKTGIRFSLCLLREKCPYSTETKTPRWQIWYTILHKFKTTPSPFDVHMHLIVISIVSNHSKKMRHSKYFMIIYLLITKEAAYCLILSLKKKEKKCVLGISGSIQRCGLWPSVFVIMSIRVSDKTSKHIV